MHCLATGMDGRRSGTVHSTTTATIITTTTTTTSTILWTTHRAAVISVKAAVSSLERLIHRRPPFTESRDHHHSESAIVELLLFQSDYMEWMRLSLSLAFPIVALATLPPGLCVPLGVAFHPHFYPQRVVAASPLFAVYKSLILNRIKIWIYQFQVSYHSNRIKGVHRNWL